MAKIKVSAAIATIPSRRVRRSRLNNLSFIISTYMVVLSFVEFINFLG
jgi:hypothetical protein